MQELLLLVILFFGFEFLALTFTQKSWPIPFLAFLLFLVAGYGATAVQNVFCAEVIGVLTCETTTTFNTELVILSGVMALLAIVLVFIRYVSTPIEKAGTEEI